MGRIPITHLDRVDRDYQKSRIDRQTSSHLGIRAAA